MTEQRQWVFCPCCGAKTRLRSFPLFCPKCRRETVINARLFRVSVADNKPA